MFIIYNPTTKEVFSRKSESFKKLEEITSDDIFKFKRSAENSIKIFSKHYDRSDMIKIAVRTESSWAKGIIQVLDKLNNVTIKEVALIIKD